MKTSEIYLEYCGNPYFQFSFHFSEKAGKNQASKNGEGGRVLHSKWSMQCWNKMSNHREKIALVNCKYALEHNCFVNTLL